VRDAALPERNRAKPLGAGSLYWLYRVPAWVGELGFEAADAGPLRIARLLEAYGMLWIDQALKRDRDG
jgi:hypothetical protein